MSTAATLSVRIKRTTRLAIQRNLPSRRPAIIVASMGRSGSTLVFDAVRQGMARARRLHWLGRYGIGIVSGSAWDLANTEFRPGVVYKTHALAHELPAMAPVKVIFLFGSASDAALSVFSCKERYGPAWIAEHLEHLRAKGPFEELPERDILRYEEQINGWLALQSAPLLALHYEHLWEHDQALSEFVGFPVQLSPRRPRSSRGGISPETADRFAKTYAALDAKIGRLPTCSHCGPTD